MRRHPVVLLAVALGLSCTVEATPGRGSPRDAARGEAPAPAPTAPAATPSPATRRDAGAAADAPTPLPAAGPMPDAPPKRAAAEIGMTVEGEGAEPRQRLSTTIAGGATQAVTLALGMRMAMQLGERAVEPTDVPALEVDLDLTVERRDRDGTVHFTFDVPAVRVGKADEVSPRLQEAVLQAGVHLDALTGTGTVSPGQAPSLAIAGDVPTEVEPTLHGFTETFAALLVPLPSVPVGIGAKWRVVGETTVAGLPTQRVATYQVREIDDARVVLAIEYEEYAVTGEVEGGARKLVGRAHAATGSGELTLRREDLLPRAAHFVANGRTHAALSLGGTSRQEVVTKLGIDARISPRAAD